MKKLLLIIILGTVSTTLFAQDNSRYEQKRKQQQEQMQREQRAADVSPTAKALKAKVDIGQYKEILTAAKTNDQTLRPYLKELVANQVLRRTPAEFYADIALVQLGDEKAFAQIIAELDSENVSVQYAAIDKLILINNKAAYRKLYELLDDTKIPKSDSLDEAFDSKSTSVMFSLGK